MLVLCSRTCLITVNSSDPAPHSDSAGEGGDALWVDKYRPSRFTELIGNERVAREALAWVKQWDWCVFGRSTGKKRARNGAADENTDEYRRPPQKLLLLSGPPGLGKTTLAHVVARHAGYEVMEINASDVRSGHDVEDRIRPVLESGSAVGSSKPVLLVIDEIDGATGAADNVSGAALRKKNKDSSRPLLRPVICICNDQNASSLARLRPHAFHVRFTRPADIVVLKRLRDVCQVERLQTDSHALSTLVSVARGDLRGCLNTLQFIKSRNGKVTEAIIRRATVGMKEAESSIGSVLNSLFCHLSKKRAAELGLTEEEESRYVARLSREVDASGKESSVAVGCFAQYARLRQYDATFSRYEKANAWLVAFDTLSAAMYTDGDFALSSYLSYMLVPFYALFQERGASRIERNQDDWECLQRTRSNGEICATMSKCLRTASSRHNGDFRHLSNMSTLQLEFVPYLNRIITPHLRPVNRQIVKQEQRALLTRLVHLMAAMELRFVQERSEDGQLSYRLDPPIDVFVTYDGKRAADIPVSRYTIRHMVATEIDELLNARSSGIVEKGSSKATASSKLFSAPDPDEPARKRRKVDEIDIADKPPVDFFGRLITTSSTSTKPKSRGGSSAQVSKTPFYRVTFKYLEGNSAAVRKPVKVQAFLD
ncbi:P-loop containing nucleoside triphosphate hydrolase protein [Fistulina hepatica ATCC 64428]|nr:P-loop containing nucleoside triphosphate hydrolase protein [Fistulina hepatica ATCC 64428]